MAGDTLANRLCRVAGIISCATVVRTLVLAAAFVAALTPITCLGEVSNELPTKATKEVPSELLSLFRQKKMPKYSPILVRIFKEEAELEVWKQDTTGHFQILKTFRSVGGRAILGRSCMRATDRLQRGSIQLCPI
jgi:murein L,D-transpeptidase YafK